MMVSTINENKILNLMNNYNNRISVIPNNKIIEVPENAKYLSDFLDDLPYDCFFNKVVTGCGGTTLALTNKENYVVAVHSLNVVKNKSEQHSNVLGVHGEMSNDDIIKYLFDYSEKPKKFIVTYDSLPRLIDIIEKYNGIDVSDFRLLVDEVQVLIRNLGEFKMEVSNNLLNNVYKFKSICYLTATPTDIQYLPEPIKKLDYIELEWPNLKNVHINHCHVKSLFQTKLTSFIINTYDNTNDDIYIFYNSKSAVVGIIENLNSLNDSILDDIDLVFADNAHNRSYFKKYLKDIGFKNIKLGYSLEVDSEGNPVDSNRKRIKFISSFGFEGVDFYSFGRDVTTIIAADAASKSMRYDISIDIPQILGRIRRDKKTGLFPKNDIYFIWKTMVELVEFESEEAVLKYIASNVIFADEALKLSNDSGFKDASKSHVSNMLKSMEPYLIYNGEFYVNNEYVMEGILSTYSVTHVNYQMALNNTDNIESSLIVSSLKNICKSENTFLIPQLSQVYLAKLDKRMSFKKAGEMYYDLYKRSAIDPSLIDDMNVLVESQDLLKEALNYFDIESIAKTQFNSTFIKDRMYLVNTIESIKETIENDYGVYEGLILSKADLLEIVKKINKDYGFKHPDKMSFMNNFYDVKCKMVNGEKLLILGDKK